MSQRTEKETTINAPDLVDHDPTLTDDFPYRLRRLGTVMSPVPGDPMEEEGVLNPAAATAPDGTRYLLPRLVSKGNISRIGLARLVFDKGIPAGVEREGLALAPERDWEQGAQNGGVEDPRVTYIAALGRYVMTYVAFGPLGPRPAVAVSDDARHWQRLGPATFDYDDALGIDFGIFPNKDCVFFPTPVEDPSGRNAIAVLHRPSWGLDDIRPGEGTRGPSTLRDHRPGIWIAFVPLHEARADLAALTRWSQSMPLAAPAAGFEALKIGAGPAPVKVPEGWLLIHHGVTGRIENSIAQQQHVNYAAGAMILDAERPWLVRKRTARPLMVAESAEERRGTVPNVVFPTATMTLEGRSYVFYGMADSRIGVAALEPNSRQDERTPYGAAKDGLCRN